MIIQSSFSSIEELKELDLTGNILVIGFAATGKSWLREQLLNGCVDHKHTVCDDYLFINDYENLLLDKVSKEQTERQKTFVEGITGYWLLLEGEKRSLYRPDLIINMEAPMAQRQRIYRIERSRKDIKALKGFDAKCLSYLNEYYKLMEGKTMPLIVTYNNTF